MEREQFEDLRDLLENGHHTRLSSMPTLPLVPALLPAVYVLLCMSYLAVPGSRPFAAALLFLSAFMAAMTLRSPWLIAMMAVPATLLVAMTGSLSVAAVPVSLICSTAYGAFLLLNVRSPLALAVPPAAFLAGLLLTGDLFNASLTWLCLPAAVVLARALRREIPRIRTICHVAVALALPLIALGLFLLIRHRGSEILLDLPTAVSAIRHAMAKGLAAWEIGVGENAGRVVLEGMELALASTLLNIMPGVVIAVLAVFGYIANLICLTLFRTYERSRYLSRRVFVLVLSLPAAAVFLLGYLVLLLIGENVGVGAQFAETVAENLMLALFPAMILAGLLCCIRIFLRTSHRLLCLICFILLFALSLYAALTVLAVLGAGSVIWQTIRRHLRFSRNSG